MTVEGEVNKLLIDNLKKTQTLESEPQYNDPFPFPNLPSLSQIDERYSQQSIAWQNCSLRWIV